MSETPIQIQSILVPLDGSALSEQALPWAVKLASEQQAQIILLRIGKTPDVYEVQDLYTLQEYQARQEEECLGYLQRIHARLEAAFRGTVRVEFDTGHASEVIVEKCKSWKPSLVVMSSHGRDGVQRWWLGSVAEKVMRHAPCPVLLVRQPETVQP